MLRYVLLFALAAAAVFATAVVPQIDLDAAMGSSKMLAGQKQTGYLRVAMTGFEQENPEERAPVNVAFVLDKSGSMQGEKIRHAKDAAILAIDKLHNDDIVSVVLYDSVVQVLVPATKVSDRDAIYNAIQRIEANGSTALFAGVSKGADELKKFLDKNRVNRIVLLSDGLANVGPASSDELGELGQSLGAEGIAVSTIGLGLGYNEDLMVQLAQSSDGNHMFAEQPADLEVAFRSEFGDVLSVVAQDVDVTITCTDGIRPIRVIGREADIEGQKIHLSLNQLYSEQTKYVIVEVEVPAHDVGHHVAIAEAAVSYRNMTTGDKQTVTKVTMVEMTDSQDVVDASVNKAVMEAAVRQIGVERYALACDLRDQGRIEEAKHLLETNVIWFVDNATSLNSAFLLEDAATNEAAQSNLGSEDWKRQRKVMKDNTNRIVSQQRTKTSFEPDAGLSQQQNEIKLDGKLEK